MGAEMGAGEEVGGGRRKGTEVAILESKARDSCGELGQLPPAPLSRYLQLFGDGDGE